MYWFNHLKTRLSLSPDALVALPAAAVGAALLLGMRSAGDAAVETTVDPAADTVADTNARRPEIPPPARLVLTGDDDPTRDEAHRALMVNLAEAQRPRETPSLVQSAGGTEAAVEEARPYGGERPFGPQVWAAKSGTPEQPGPQPEPSADACDRYCDAVRKCVEMSAYDAQVCRESCIATPVPAGSRDFVADAPSCDELFYRRRSLR